MRSIMLGSVVVFLCSAWLGAEEPVERRDPQRFEKAIQAFEKQDAKQPPEKGQILFLGSSSIRLWDLEKYFPQQSVINRGFGGSCIYDAYHYAERIVLPYQPKAIVLYAGDNDIAAGLSPQQVAKDFEQLAGLIHEKLPNTRLLYIAIKPSLKRWNLVENMQQANRLIRKQTQQADWMEYIDIFPPMLNEQGEPKPELFVKDGLHLSPAGYELWTKKVKDALEVEE